MTTLRRRARYRVPRRGTMLRTAIVVLGHLAILLPAAALTVEDAQSWQTDLPLYQTYGEAFAAGGTPYKSFSLEYPPLSLLAFVPPALAGTAEDAAYPVRFAVWMSVFMAASSAAFLHAGGQAGWARRTIVYFALLIPASPWVLWRFDALPATVTVVALILVHFRLPAAAGVTLAVGGLTKVYPLVVAPVIFAYWLARKDSAGARRFLVALTATVGLSIVLLASFIPEAARSIIGYHADRTLHIGSLAGAFVSLGRALGLVSAEISIDHASTGIVSPWSSPALAVSAGLGIVALAAVSIRAYRAFARAALGQSVPLSLLATFAVGSLLTFMLAGKVLSVQYAVWLLPAAAALPIPLAGALVLALVCNLAVYPLLYEQLLVFDVVAIGALNVRNALMVAVLVAIVVGPPASAEASSPRVASPLERRS